MGPEELGETRRRRRAAWDDALAALSRETGKKFDKRDDHERVNRGAVVQFSDDLATELGTAAEQFARCARHFGRWQRRSNA